jgi:hypothetical protein
MARAHCATIRTRLLKIGALVKVSVRRVTICFSSSFPLQTRVAAALTNIQAAYPLRC